MKKITTIILLSFSVLISFKGESQVSMWSVLNSGTTTTLLGVWAVSPSVCYVCGNSGLIMKTTDGGATWVTQTSTVSNTLYSICFTDANNGVAVGDAGSMVRTTNGGTTWSSVSGTVQNLRCVYFYDPSTGYAVGGTPTAGLVLKSTDGGASWIAETNSSTNGIYSIKFTSATDGYFCVYNGSIFKTTNGGTTWSALVSGTTTVLSSLDFSGVNNGVVTGVAGTIRKTTDAGATWTGIASGTTDQLSDIKFVDASNGFVVGFNTAGTAGSILKTTDGGNTWSITLPATPSLYRANFVNINCGYAVGNTGTILKYYSNVGISENENENNISVYPNPASDKINLSFANTPGKTLITVNNSLGQLVYKNTVENNSMLFNYIIDLSSNAKGVYFINLHTDKGDVTKRVVLAD